MIVKSYAEYFQAPSPLYPFTVLKRQFDSEAPCGVFLGCLLVVGEIDKRSLGQLLQGSWDLKPTVACDMDGTLAGGIAALLPSKASRPPVQATRPSLVILADRKE